MNSKLTKEPRYPRLRAFVSAAALTSCLLVMGAGFLVADYNTRRMGTGESSLRIDMAAQDGKIMVNILGHELVIGLSKPVQEWTGRVWALLSPEVRIAVWLYEAECEAVPQLFKLIGA